MSYYVVSLGFNWNSSELVNPLDGHRSGLYDLQNAAVLYQPNGGIFTPEPAWFTRFVVGDTIAFWVYDLASVTASGSWALDLSVFFAPASPIPDPPQDVALSLSDSVPNSAVWSPDAYLPPWAQPGEQVYPFRRAGTYEMKARLNVTDQDPKDPVTKPFVFDPEIIVGGGS